MHKSGSKQKINNYRPISVLPLLSKIFERYIYNRIVSFINKHKVLISFQFGFQKGKSTTDALLNVIECMYEKLNNNKHALVISVDLSKAFDTVSNNILIKKLFRYGIRGWPLRWIESYLADRNQCVRIGYKFSRCRIVGAGVPQGSILGPLLFLLYVNELPDIENSVNFTLFADDTTIVCSNSCYSELITKANTLLSKLHDWTVNNRLSFNTNKTTCLLVTNRRHNVETPSVVNVNRHQVPYDDCMKFLGVNVDNKLSFSNHIDSICMKISKTIGIFHKIHRDVPEYTLVNLYYSLVYPQLIYGVLLWGDSADININPLIMLQKKIIRLITCSSYLAHTMPLFRKTKILNIRDIYKYVLGVYVFSRRALIEYPMHDYNTRNRNIAIPSFQRLVVCERSLSFDGPKLWNSLPEDIKNCNSIASFKRNLKLHFVSKYSDNE